MEFHEASATHATSTHAFFELAGVFAARFFPADLFAQAFPIRLESLELGLHFAPVRIDTEHIVDPGFIPAAARGQPLAGLQFQGLASGAARDCHGAAWAGPGQPDRQPGLREPERVVDPDAGYFWLSCKTARNSEAGSNAIPGAARQLVRMHACLHRQ